MNIRWKLHFEKAAVPLGVTAGLLLMEYASGPLGLPTVETLVAFFKHAFETYGLWALGVAAFIEGLFLVSLYLPGSLVIFSAILFSDRSFGSLSEILAICWLAFMSAAVLNYAIGYYGFYRAFKALGANRLIEDTQHWMKRYGVLTYAIAGFHPNYIGMVEVCSGVSREGLARTFVLAGSAMAVTGPILVFGSALFIDSIVQEDGMGNMFLVFIGIFALWALGTVAKGLWEDFSTPQPAMERT